MKTNVGLVEYVKKALAEGWVYWYGTTGVPCTEALLKRKSAQYPDHYTEKRMVKYRSHIEAGKYCADCINLVKGYMWLDEDTGKQIYASNGCPDTNADGMYSKAKDKGPIRTLPEIPGVMLYSKGHAGVYIGDGYAIEARGFAYGVVKTKVSSRPWTNWYMLPKLNYEIVESSAPAGNEGCPYFEPVRLVKRGNNKWVEDVRWVQWHLDALGYDIGKYGIDGDFGKDTEQAVKQFQSVAGLDVDGQVGPLTRAALIEALKALEEG